MNVEYCIQRTFPGEGLRFFAEQGVPMSGIPDYSFTENGYPKSKHRGISAPQILSNNTTMKENAPHAPLSCTPSGKFSDTWVMRR